MGAELIYRAVATNPHLVLAPFLTHPTIQAHELQQLHEPDQPSYLLMYLHTNQATYLPTYIPYLRTHIAIYLPASPDPTYMHTQSNFFLFSVSLSSRSSKQACGRPPVCLPNCLSLYLQYLSIPSASMKIFFQDLSYIQTITYHHIIVCDLID